jgi:hypothetical protein
MMSALGDRGHFGFTAVANSRDEADALFARAGKVFDDEAGALAGGGP